ncbi:hypothetical protein F5B20DRAFT_587468 [Whalleya microplaca]|nr:hypothetical protein F5B20DRAFT_587468 [Whalleya microplaca]
MEANRQNNHQRSRSVDRSLSLGAHSRLPALRKRSRSLDTTTFQQQGLQKVLHELQEELTTTCETINSGALHFQGIRRNTQVRSFLDLLHDHEQQQLNVSFLPLQQLLPEDFIALLSSLDRVKPIMASAGWRIRRYMRLLNIFRHRPETGVRLFNHDLDKLVDLGQENAEMEVRQFETAMTPRMESLVGDLIIEVLHLQELVGTLQQRSDSLVDGWRFASALGPRVQRPQSKSRFGRTSTWLRKVMPTSTLSNQKPSREAYLMSGASSPAPATPHNSKTRNWKINLGVHFENIIIPFNHGDLTSKAYKLRYHGTQVWGRLQAYRHRDDVDDPAAGKARLKAWEKLKKDIEQAQGAPSTELSLLRNKVKTEIIIAERATRQE